MGQSTRNDLANSRRSYLSPAHKVKIYNQGGVRYDAAQAINAGLNDVKFSAINAFGGYQNRPVDGSVDGSTRVDNIHGQTGREIAGGYKANPNLLTTGKGKSGRPSPDGTLVGGSTGANWNTDLTSMITTDADTNLSEDLNSYDPNNYPFTNVPRAPNKTDVRQHNRAGTQTRYYGTAQSLQDDFGSGMQINRMVALDQNDDEAPADSFGYAANLIRGEFSGLVEYKPLNAAPEPFKQEIALQGGVNNVKLSRFFVDDSQSSLVTDGRISVVDTTDTNRPSDSDTMFVTNRQTPMRSADFLGYVSSTHVKATLMTYNQARDMIRHFRQGALNSFGKSNTSGGLWGTQYFQPIDERERIGSDGARTPSVDVSSTATQHLAGQFGLIQTRENWRLKDLEYSNRMASQVGVTNQAARQIAGDTTDMSNIGSVTVFGANTNAGFAQGDSDIRQYVDNSDGVPSSNLANNLTSDTVNSGHRLGPFVYSSDIQTYELDFGGDGVLKGASDKAEKPVSDSTPGGNTWPGFERFKASGLAGDQDDPSQSPDNGETDNSNRGADRSELVWSKSCGRGMPFGMSAFSGNVAAHNFFRKGNKLRIIDLGNGTETNQTHFERAGWIANKDGHGSTPAVGDIFTLKVDIRREIVRQNNRNYFGDYDDSRQAYMALVRKNGVTVDKLPTFSEKSLKRLTFANNPDGATAYASWLALASPTTNTPAGGGFQVGRMIYQTANNEVYGTSAEIDSLGGNITVNNDVTYSAVIRESVVDSISGEWYLTLAGESGTFNTDRVLRSRAMGHTHATNPFIYDKPTGQPTTIGAGGTHDIGHGIGRVHHDDWPNVHKPSISKVNTGRRAGYINQPMLVGTAGYPIARRIQYETYNVDKDGQVLSVNKHFVEDPPAPATQQGVTNANTGSETGTNSSSVKIIETHSRVDSLGRPKAHALIDSTVAPVAAPTTTRKNELAVSKFRGTVYPFKFEIKLDQYRVNNYNSFTRIRARDQRTRSHTAVGAGMGWLDEPVVNMGFLFRFDENSVDEDSAVLDRVRNHNMPRLDIPFDCQNPSMYKISVSDFTVNMHGEYETSYYYNNGESSSARDSVMAMIASPGICIVRSEVFESDDYNDYNEIVAVSRADNGTRNTGHVAATAYNSTDSYAHESGDSRIKGNNSADANYTIPAMYYYCEKPGSYIVTYIAKTCIGKPFVSGAGSSSGHIKYAVDRISFRSGNGSVTHNVPSNKFAGDGGPMVTIETV